MPEDYPNTALTHVDTRDFLRGVKVVVYDGEMAEQLVRELFLDRHAQEAAFASIAAGNLELEPLVH